MRPETPCTNCLRAGTACSYPQGPGRAAKRGRVTVDSQVRDRLLRLEHMIRRLEGPVQQVSEGELRNQRLGAGLLADPLPPSIARRAHPGGLPRRMMRMMMRMQNSMIPRLSSSLGG